MPAAARTWKRQQNAVWCDMAAGTGRGPVCLACWSASRQVCCHRARQTRELDAGEFARAFAGNPLARTAHRVTRPFPGLGSVAAGCTAGSQPGTENAARSTRLHLISLRLLRNPLRYAGSQLPAVGGQIERRAPARIMQWPRHTPITPGPPQNGQVGTATFTHYLPGRPAMRRTWIECLP